ncbi:MAG: NUDIX hydrolase, partial [Lentisphaeria bacterium]|nr:NUDIX hydrolase [Lentisphaeria bacterium]
MEMKILNRETIASGGWISLQKITYLGHDGKTRTWESASRVHSQGAVMMIPVTKPGDKLIIIRQFRPPTGRLVYEFPAGLINPDEDPKVAAVRELKEETGYVGTVDYCSPRVFTSP